MNATTGITTGSTTPAATGAAPTGDTITEAVIVSTHFLVPVLLAHINVLDKIANATGTIVKVRLWPVWKSALCSSRPSHPGTHTTGTIVKLLPTQQVCNI